MFFWWWKIEYPLFNTVGLTLRIRKVKAKPVMSTRLRRRFLYLSVEVHNAMPLGIPTKYLDHARIVEKPFIVALASQGLKVLNNASHHWTSCELISSTRPEQVYT